MIAGLSELFQKNEVAVGVYGDETEAAGKRFVLSDSEVLFGHRLGQAWGLGVVIVDYRLFNVNIDLLLCPIGGRYKAVETRQIQEETNQANAAGPDFDADHMESHHESV